VPPQPARTQAEKPGYKTTEFWITILAMIGSFGVTFFHWAPEQSERWSQITATLAPLMAMLVSFLLSSQYSNKRTDLKKALAALPSGRTRR
jgi:hypothetical protein